MKIFNLKYFFLSCLIGLLACTNGNKHTQTAETEAYRPAIHFTPPSKWMNDPNGLVFFNGTYHLFYQHYPDSTVWGPMHWGHATSTDLVHWTHQPIALYPDSLGYIFSGSAVVDSNNTSGFGMDGRIPLVAMFTHHDPEGEAAGTTTYQNQSLAYSLDEGKTWTKYAGNPVLKNPGIKDFRDPKVSWNPQVNKWILTLATLDRISFYSSPDLKQWTKESEFGKEFGAHGGVWECPDLFPFDHEGKQVWILLVSINPGGPNGGSATQYFTGDFDGHRFTPYQTDTRWIDYGPDDYAGVTWSNVSGRKLFLGWMSNWLYAAKVPTKAWRSAMTIPRELSLARLGDKYYLVSQPAREIDEYGNSVDLDIRSENDKTRVSGLEKTATAYELRFTARSDRDLSVKLANGAEEVVIGFQKDSNRFYIDRSNAGVSDFYPQFKDRSGSPRISKDQKLQIQLIVDRTSVELMADGGLNTMTSIFFPKSLLNQITISGAKPDSITGKSYPSILDNKK